MIFPDYMTDAERMERIGELLAKGVALMLSREKEEERQPHPKPVSDGEPSLSPRLSSRATLTEV